MLKNCLFGTYRATATKKVFPFRASDPATIRIGRLLLQITSN
jgi:hypothetical protein